MIVCTSTYLSLSLSLPSSNNVYSPKGNVVNFVTLLRRLSHSIPAKWHFKVPLNNYSSILFHPPPKTSLLVLKHTITRVNSTDILGIILCGKCTHLQGNGFFLMTYSIQFEYDVILFTGSTFSKKTTSS